MRSPAKAFWSTLFVVCDRHLHSFVCCRSFGGKAYGNWEHVSWDGGRKSLRCPAGTASKHRADSRFVASQWETELLCNNVSHWLSVSLESALQTAVEGYQGILTSHKVGCWQLKSRNGNIWVSVLNIYMASKLRHHYIDIKRAAWCLKTLATWLFVQQFVRTNIMTNIITCPLWGEFAGDWWFLLTEGQ